MVILALGAALALVLATALLAWRSHARRRLRFARAVQGLDESLAGLGESLRRALESASAPREAPQWTPTLDPDLDELFVAQPAERARRTEVEAAALRTPDADDVAIGVSESARHDGDASDETP